MPDERKWPRWYVDEYIGQWTLNESNPDGSDGYLADFGTLGEPACHRAAHAHNLHDRLVAMLRRMTDVCIDDKTCEEAEALIAEAKKGE